MEANPSQPHDHYTLLKQPDKVALIKPTPFRGEKHPFLLPVPTSLLPKRFVPVLEAAAKGLGKAEGSYRPGGFFHSWGPPPARVIERRTWRALFSKSRSHSCRPINSTRRNPARRKHRRTGWSHGIEAVDESNASASSLLRGCNSATLCYALRTSLPIWETGLLPTRLTLPDYKDTPIRERMVKSEVDPPPMPLVLSLLTPQAL
jgi:hypothetical protein